MGILQSWSSMMEEILFIISKPRDAVASSPPLPSPPPQVLHRILLIHFYAWCPSHQLVSKPVSHLWVKPHKEIWLILKRQGENNSVNMTQKKSEQHSVFFCPVIQDLMEASDTVVVLPSGCFPPLSSDLQSYPMTDTWVTHCEATLIDAPQKSFFSDLSVMLYFFFLSRRYVNRQQKRKRSLQRDCFQQIYLC